ncbi:MAG: hypothetical protein NTY69_10845 [Methylococcales bacterium]|nr:hypothetical protein [Methylococcales bacterium]
MDIENKFEITEPFEKFELPPINEEPKKKISLLKETVKTDNNYEVDRSSFNEKVPTEQVQNVDQAKIGQQIAEQMAAQGYHPVVIFGSSNSGKSSLLGSLLSYFQIDIKQSIGIYLGEPLISINTPHGKWAYSEAESFFYKSVQEFLDGTAHAATKSRHPFFIPIIIKPANLPEMKFAFMESNGEWYKPLKDTGKYFPELKEEINSILKHYQDGISFIYVAPYTQVNAWSSNQIDIDRNNEEINDANLALVGVLNSYDQMRIFKTDDSHMFLITKWDASKDASKHDSLPEHLQSVDVETVEDVASSLYTKGFSAFNNLKVSPANKNIMQYCSGVISGSSIIKASPELKPIINRYPQTMWNWLYGNATRSHHEINTHLVLIPKPKPPKKTFLDKINQFFTKILN